MGGWNGWGTVGTYVNCGWMEWLGYCRYICELWVDGMVGDCRYICELWVDGMVGDCNNVCELSNSSFRNPVCFIVVKTCLITVIRAVLLLLTEYIWGKYSVTKH